MNFLREFCHSLVLAAEFWLYGSAYTVARLLTWDDDEGGHPFENHLVPAPEVAIV